ncbi:hypothetical protein Gotur_034690 [Gossypium turneri]
MAPLIRPDRHISDAANQADSYRVIRGRVNGLKKASDARLMPYLEQAGFRSAALIRTSDLRYDLLSALVERWRPETHTFHFLCGECTVTLEDVAMQLGLPIDGSPVTGVSSFTDLVALCYQLLGESLEDEESNFSGLKFTWLKGLRRFSSVVPGALSGDKPRCYRHGRMPHIAAVLGALSYAIFGIG